MYMYMFHIFIWNKVIFLHRYLYGAGAKVELGKPDVFTHFTLCTRSNAPKSHPPKTESQQ